MPLGCTRCHQSPAFSGPCKPDGHFARFRKHDIPQTEIHRLHDDVVRFAVTGRETDRHKFKVPTLRNVALAAPNLHDGVVATLPDAVRIMAATQLKIRLDDAQVSDIVAFLEALTGEFPAFYLPRLPPVSGTSLLGE